MADNKVRSSTIPFIALVVEADPDFYDRSDEYTYQFSNGTRKKAPNENGIYEQQPEE
jgi:hypothetical protein